MNVAGAPAGRSGRLHPAWRGALAVIAHPDDESFGLGAILGQLAGGGAAVHVLCFTRGEASTLNQTGAELSRARETELRQAGAELGVASVTLLDYPDGGLAGVAPAELASHVTVLAARTGADGLLVFDDTGITGHPDHKAATRAAVRAGPARRASGPGVDPARGRGGTTAGRNRPGFHRPASRPHRPVRAGQPGPATAGRPAARQPGLAHRRAMAAAATPGRMRAPALARRGQRE